MKRKKKIYITNINGGKLQNKNINKRVKNNYQCVKNIFKCVIVILPKEMNQHIAKRDEST